MLGFLVTAVVLPVLGVVVVAEFDGLDKLGKKVGPRFGLIFTLLIYLSIGPGLGIPRAASVPFEMAVAPYLPEGASFGFFMLMYSMVFFLIAGWLAMTPNKLVDRIGKFLTPSLLVLLTGLFISFLFAGKMDVAPAQAAYQEGALVKGFLEGYQTMDTIAALNFGLVIATTLRSLGVTEKKGIMHYTVRAGFAAGTILSTIYLMLSFMGMKSSAVYDIQENGAWTLRCIVHQLFGDTGAVLLAMIFTLACLTTCVGLITSISQYFSTLVPKVSYHKWALMISVFSFVVCNQGLTTILNLSVPVLNAIYPISIVLIVLGLLNKKLGQNPYIYPATVTVVGFISVVYAAEQAGLPMGFVGKVCRYLPFYDYGMGWVAAALAVMMVSVVLYRGAKVKAAEAETL